MGEFIVPPSLGGLTLFKYLIIFTFVIHLPFICSLMGSVLLSFGFSALGKDQKNETYSRFAKDLIDKVSINFGVGVLLGLLPLATLTIIFLQLMYGTGSLMSSQWLVVIGLATVGIVSTYAYKNSFDKRDNNFLMHFGLAKAGFGLLAVAYFVFLSNKAFIIYPENWAIVEYPILQSFASINITAFIHFMLLTLVFTGAAIIFHFRVWPSQEEQEQDKEYRNFACKIGLYTVLVGIILQPVFGIVDLYFLPEVAVSQEVIGLYIANVAWGLVTCLTILAAIRYSGQPEKGATLLVVLSVLGLSAFFCMNHLSVLTVILVIVVCTIAYLNSQTSGYVAEKWVVALAFGSLTLMLGSDFHTRNNAMKEHIAFLQDFAPTAGHVDPAVAGEKIYKEKCAVCHSIDGAAGAGPSFLGIFGREGIVVTDGEERQITVDDEYIIQSMQTPGADIVKGFGNMMPNPNLDEEQIKAVIAFLKTLKE